MIDIKFDTVNNFSDNGLALVALDGKYGCIDTTGAWVIEPQYDDLVS